MKKIDRIIAALTISALIASISYGQTNSIEEVMDRVLEIISGDDYPAVSVYLEKQGEPLQVMDTYSNVVKKLYFAEKGAKSLVIVGKAGIAYCEAKAKSIFETDPDLAYKYRSWAKTIAYDISANTWPGWNDEGVVISAEDMAEGKKMAEFNLKMANELNKPQDKIAIAYWLLGAHEIAAQAYSKAIIAFEKGKELHSDDPLGSALCEGFIGISQILSGNTSSGESRLNAALKIFENDGGEDAKFYIWQLNTALEVFSRS